MVLLDIEARELQARLEQLGQRVNEMREYL